MARLPQENIPRMVNSDMNLCTGCSQLFDTPTPEISSSNNTIISIIMSIGIDDKMHIVASLQADNREYHDRAYSSILLNALFKLKNHQHIKCWAIVSRQEEKP